MGIVYIFVNDSMPEIIKIGVTDDNTSIPLPFRFHYAIESDRYKDIESLMHNAFSDYRVRKNREFFRVDPERAVAALKISGSSEVKLTNEMIDEKGNRLNEKTKQYRRLGKKFSFDLINVPIGAELTFTRDESKKCKVVNHNRVEYEGEIFSLSKLADLLLQELGYEWKSVQGPSYFEFEGKILNEIRKELESGDDRDDIED